MDVNLGGMLSNPVWAGNLRTRRLQSSDLPSSVFARLTSLDVKRGHHSLLGLVWLLEGPPWVTAHLSVLFPCVTE